MHFQGFTFFFFFYDVKLFLLDVLNLIFTNCEWAKWIALVMSALPISVKVSMI